MVFILHGRCGMNPAGLTRSFLRGGGKCGVRKVTLRRDVAQCGTRRRYARVTWASDSSPSPHDPVRLRLGSGRNQVGAS